jgi:hypothetical protein
MAAGWAGRAATARSEHLPDGRANPPLVLTGAFGAGALDLPFFVAGLLKIGYDRRRSVARA